MQNADISSFLSLQPQAQTPIFNNWRGRDVKPHYAAMEKIITGYADKWRDVPGTPENAQEEQADAREVYAALEPYVNLLDNYYVQKYGKDRGIEKFRDDLCTWQARDPFLNRFFIAIPSLFNDME